jgi:hypothetical protein
VTLQLPPELAGILDRLGMQWPQFDEDRGYEAAQAWSDAITQLVQNAEQGNAAAQSVNFAVQSTTSQEFNDYWDKWTGGADAYYDGAVTHAQKVAALLIQASDDAEWAKINIIAQLTLLAIQIGIDLALAFFTDGASLAEMFIAMGVTRALIARILENIVMGVLMTTLPDAVTDVVELARGRMSMDGAAWDRLGTDVAQGTAFGVVGGLANEALGATLGPRLRGLADKASGTLSEDAAASPLVKNLANRGAETATVVISGAAGNSLFNGAVYGFNALSGNGRNGGETLGQALTSGLSQGGGYGLLFGMLPGHKEPGPVTEPDTVTGNLADGTAFSGTVDENGTATVTTTGGQTIAFDTTTATGAPPEPPVTVVSEGPVTGPTATAIDAAVPAVVATDVNTGAADTPVAAPTAAVTGTAAVDPAQAATIGPSTTTMPDALRGGAYQVTDPNAQRTVNAWIDADGNTHVIGSVVSDHSGSIITYDPNGVQTGVYADVSKVAPDQVSAGSSGLYQTLTDEGTKVYLTADGHITQVVSGAKSEYYAVGDNGPVLTGSSVVGPDKTVTHYSADGTPLYMVDSHDNITVAAETQPVRELPSLDTVADPLVAHAPQELSAQARAEDANALITQSAVPVRDEARSEGGTALATAAGGGGSAAASRDWGSGAPGRGHPPGEFDRLLNGGSGPTAAQRRDPGETRTSAAPEQPDRRPFQSGGGHDDQSSRTETPTSPISSEQETRLAAMLMNENRNAAATMLDRLRTALAVMAGVEPSELEGVFYLDRLNSGTVPADVTMDELIAHGTTRELLSSFVVAAVDSGQPHAFDHVVLDLARAGDVERLAAAGMDVKGLHDYIDFLQRRLNHWPEPRDFTEPVNLADFFSPGSVIASDLRDPARRIPRLEQNALQHLIPLRELELNGVGLSSREGAYLMDRAQRDATAAERLEAGRAPFPTGESMYLPATPDQQSAWFLRNTVFGKMRAVSGPSGTAARLLAVARFLRTPPDLTKDFAAALTGYMVSSHHHSMSEVVQGLDAMHFYDTPVSRENITRALNLDNLYGKVPGLVREEPVTLVADPAHPGSAVWEVQHFLHQIEERPTDPHDMGAQLDWARDVYREVRENPGNAVVNAVVRALERVPRPDGVVGYSPEEIAAVRSHLFVEEHELDDGSGGTISERFDTDPEIAAAWQRMASGGVDPRDLALLDHELAETDYLRQHPGAPLAQAHQAANDVANWEQTLPDARREALYEHVRNTHGDPGVLREGGGEPGDGQLPLGQQSGRAEPGAGHGQGDGTAAAGGGRTDDPVPGGGQEGVRPQGEQQSLAGAGDDGQLRRPFQSGGQDRSSGPDPTWHEPGGRAEAVHLINASAVPGSSFRGHAEAPITAHIHQIRNSIDEAVRANGDAHSGLRVEPVANRRKRWTYEFTHDSGLLGPNQPRAFRVRVEIKRLGDYTAARTVVNHDRGEHVVQISDQISARHVRRAVAHEIGELIADRQRYFVDKLDAFAPDEGNLRPGGPVADVKPTPHDFGRVQELRVLGEDLDRLAPEGGRTPDQQREYEYTHREAMALVEHLGLRDGTPGAPERRALVLDPRLLSSDGQAHVISLFRDAGGHPDTLSGADRRLLGDIRDQARRDQAAFDAHRARLRPKFVPPIPDGGRKISPRRLAQLAAQAARRRAERSWQTLADLRRQAAESAESGAYPKVSLQVGGGASLSGRDPRMLLVDARGRWHNDNAAVIAQTADQLRGLREAGLGDPFQFVGSPEERVPVAAMRYWEDDIAAQGPVINGAATFRMESGRLLADIRPADGSAPLTVEVEGTPVIATGSPPQTVPGIDRSISGMYGALNETAHALDRLGGTDALAAKNEIMDLSWRDLASASKSLSILDAHGIDRSALPDAVSHSLDSVTTWRHLRDAYPDRVIIGDEANSLGTDPEAATQWIVLGTGGTSISGVENLLTLSTTAKFTMIGALPPDGLAENTQWRQVRALHDLGYDPEDSRAASRMKDGAWPNPGASGRLTMVYARQMNIVGLEDRTGPGGPRFAAVVSGSGHSEFEGDGVIASLGGRDGVPPAIAEMVDRALKRDPGSASGQLLFNDDGQYLGYRITVDGRTIDVTGAASRFPPRAPFFEAGPGDADPTLPASGGDTTPGTVWATQDRRYLWDGSSRDAPPEGGNFDGGYGPTATAASAAAASRRSGTPAKPMPSSTSP